MIEQNCYSHTRTQHMLTISTFKETTPRCREQMCHTDIKHTGRLPHRQHYTGACQSKSVRKALKHTKPLLMSVGLSKQKKRHKSGRQMHVVEDNKRASQNIALHLVSPDTLY